MPGSFNRQYQDRLFKAIFGREEHKDWLLSLYNALNGSSYTDPSAIEINTIEGIIYVTMKNDISFLIDSQLNLYEQQSSYNPNMPLRGLMYFAELYQKHLTELPLETVLHLQKEISVGVCADR
ncbi:MAG: Rpn family recombination-promoting nuclease/putative transposase [Treponema porcinum]|nr:Rpn family recombination-promoting nuclease/putative transposase [Treponema porcinum]